jgi:hypothetical protein
MCTLLPRELAVEPASSGAPGQDPSAVCQTSLGEYTLNHAPSAADSEYPSPMSVQNNTYSEGTRVVLEAVNEGS